MSHNKPDAGRIDGLLEKHGLRKTPLRRRIIQALLKTTKPLSQADLITALSQDDDSVDRVSIYRNLSQLCEAGVVHEVDANSYIFCAHECEDHAHLLLFCQQCHKHQEIKDHDRIDRFMKALGTLRFFGTTQPILLRGICESCSAKMTKNAL